MLALIFVFVEEQFSKHGIINPKNEKDMHKSLVENFEFGPGGRLRKNNMPIFECLNLGHNFRHRNIHMFRAHPEGGVGSFGQQ